MKIIAAINKTNFLVEMHEDEIVKAAGFSTTYNREWEHLNCGREIKVGSVINVAAAYDFHQRILNRQKEASGAANTLRALADLIGGTLPDVVIPPTNPDPDFAEVEGGAA